MSRLGAGIVALAVLVSPAPLSPATDGHISMFVDYLPNRPTRSSCARGSSPRKSCEPSQRLTDHGVRVSSRGSSRAGPDDRPHQTNVASTAISRVQEASLDLSGNALRSSCRIQARRLGTPRRAAADRRHQSARRVAVLLRRPERGAHAGGARAARGSCSATRVDRRRSTFRLFRRGRFDQLDEATSPFNLASDFAAGLGTCLAIGCPTLPPVFVERRTADDSRQCAGRRALERNRGTRRLERRRHIAASSRSGSSSSQRRPAIRR